MSLDALFRPRSVAVIGASRRPETLSGRVFHNLLARRFSGVVYPVNPAAEVVQSVRAYPSLAEVPGEVDLAVVAVPRDHVLPVVEECGARGVRALVVITAGFGETGPEGRERQQRLVETVRHHGMRMVGPNCLGLLNTDPEVELNATFSDVWPPTGNVAFSSQSGALGVAILDYARNLGIGIRQFISVGNKADVSGNDLLEYWERDPGVGVILLYLESLGNPGRFMRISRRVARHKPIVVVKSGRTEAGARAASSHTGSLAGLDVAVDALFEQSGVLRTDTIEELFDLALLLANQPVPRGDRVAILSNAGGPGIMATDACSSFGLRLPPLSAATERGLRAFLPAEASVRNPVDMIASAGPRDYERALRLLRDDDAFDAVLVLIVPPDARQAPAVAAAIREGGAGSAKPILTCFMGVQGIPEALSSLRHGRFPSYAFPEAAARALSRAVRYGRWLARPEGRVPPADPAATERSRAILAVRGLGGEEGRWLDPDEARALLEAWGLPAPASRIARTAQEASEAAEAIGYPVAVKLVSQTITHKSDVGGVHLGLESRADVLDAFREIRARLEARGEADAMEGVLVQAMAPGGVETFVGVTSDPVYGPLIGFGIGGVNVEVWRDVAFRVHPLTDRDAEEMIEQIRGVRLLDGFRGAPPADRAALRDALLRVSSMVGELPEVCELDLNPLVARPPGEGVMAVDARVRVAVPALEPRRAR